MNKHLITETNDGLTLEEKIDFNAETITDLTPEQLEKLYNNRRAEQLLTEQEHRLNLQSKYTSRPLPGNTNDDRWICLKAHFPDDKADQLQLAHRINKRHPRFQHHTRQFRRPQLS